MPKDQNQAARSRAPEELTDQQKKVLQVLKIKSSAKLTDRDLTLFTSFGQDPEKLWDLLEDLPADRKEQFNEDIKQVKEYVTSGKVKKANAAMKQFYEHGLAEVNGYAQSIRADDVQAKVERVRIQGTRYRTELTRLDTEMNALLNAARQHPQARTMTDPVALGVFLNTFVAVETNLRTRLVGVEAAVSDLTRHMAQNPPKSRLDEIHQELNVVEKYLQVDVSTERTQVAAATQNLQRHGAMVQPSAIREEFERKAMELNTLINQIKSLQKRDNQQGADDVLALVPPRPKKDTKGKMPERGSVQKALEEFEKGQQSWSPQEKQAKQQHLMGELVRLQAERDAAFREAMIDYRRANYRDRKELTSARLDELGDAQDMTPFDMQNVLMGLKLPAKLSKLSDKHLDRASQDVKTGLTGLMQQLPPESDPLFDLGLKDKTALVAELAKCRGIHLEKASKNERAILETLADSLFETINTQYPHKATSSTHTFQTADGKQATAPPSFSAGGKNYINPTYIASGGFGHVLRYEDAANPGQFVALKTLVDPEGRDDMVAEARNLRMANGGEGGQGHPNILAMKGLVRDDQGNLFLATELASGGGLDRMGETLAGAASTGILSEDARQALGKHYFQQALEGMKQLHQARLLHRDIKNENYFLDENGVLKMGDFGSAKNLNKEGETEASTQGVSAQFAGKEHKADGGTVTTKADTYSLGILLTRLMSPVAGQDSMGSSFVSDWDFTPQGKPVTALDRLRKAMLDPDQDKRPDLRAVEFSDFLESKMEFQRHPPERIQDLLKATNEYNKHVVPLIKDEQSRVFRLEGQIRLLEKEKEGKVTSKMQELDAQIQGLQTQLAGHKQAIAMVLQRPELKPHIDAFKKASDALSSHNAPAPQTDWTTVDFVRESLNILKRCAPGGKVEALPSTHKKLMAVHAQLNKLLKTTRETTDPVALKNLYQQAQTHTDQLETLALSDGFIDGVEPTPQERANASKWSLEYRELGGRLKQRMESL